MNFCNSRLIFLSCAYFGKLRLSCGQSYHETEHKDIGSLYKGGGFLLCNLHKGVKKSLTVRVAWGGRIIVGIKIHLIKGLNP